MMKRISNKTTVALKNCVPYNVHSSMHKSQFQARHKKGSEGDKKSASNDKLNGTPSIKGDVDGVLLYAALRRGFRSARTHTVCENG